MRAESLLHNTEIVMGTSARTSSTGGHYHTPWVDMSDCDGCLFILTGSSLAGSKTLTVRVIGSTISSSTGNAHMYSAHCMSTVGGFSTAVGEMLNKMALVDITKPTYRYNRLLVHGTTGVPAGSLHFVSIKYGLRLRGSTIVDATSCLGANMSTFYASPTT